MKRGDRVVVPFPIACGHCFLCNHDLPGHYHAPLTLSQVEHGYKIFRNKEDNCVKVVSDPWS